MGEVDRGFLFLFLLVLTTLCCCLGLVTASRRCEATGGHFEGYWNGSILTCAGRGK